jgi:putative exosortase-associated protein (TIGR04073 family)
MKIKTAVFILCLASFAQLVFAENAGHKLARGLEGIVTSPVEYLNQYQIASDENGVVASSATMVLGGTAMTVKRIINGAYDVVTFPVSLPKNYGLLLYDRDETALKTYRAIQGKEVFPLGDRSI